MTLDEHMCCPRPASTEQSPNWEYNMSYLGQAWNQGMFGWTLGNT